MPNITEITDLSVPELDVFLRLTEAQLRNRLEPEKGIFIAQSTKVIRLALDAGCKPIAILAERKHIESQAYDILALCQNDIPVYTTERALMESITGFPLTRGILCAMKRPPLPAAEDLCIGAHRIAVLENIADATNIGAIFRSAAALCIDAVLVTPSCSDPLNRRSVRVSMGTVFQVPWTYIGSSPEDWPDAGIAQLRAAGFHTAAMALSDDSVPIDDPRVAAEDKLAIILGTEGDGLSAHTVAACDYTVRIPMALGVDSLNVAAAGAVAFWELRHR